MIDLRNAVFKSDFNQNVTTVRQNLQTSYVNRLISIVDADSRFDNITKASVYYNLEWLKNNLNQNVGDLSTKQHRKYLAFLINNVLKEE